MNADEDVSGELHYPPLHLLFEQVTGVIFSPLKHHKKKDREESLVELSAKEEVSPSGCSHHFGYLANHHVRTNDIPDKCLVCRRILKCIAHRDE